MAPLWWRDIFRNFCVLLYVGMTPQTVIGLHSVWVRDLSGTRRFWFGNVSVDSTQFCVMSDLIRSWIGLESVSGRPTYARCKTDLIRLTNHLPSVAKLRPTRPRTLPDKTDTTPTYNRQTTDNFIGERSFKHVWKISPRQICLPEHKPTPNRQNWINTDCKPISSRIWWFLSVWGRFGRCDGGTLNTFINGLFFARVLIKLCQGGVYKAVFKASNTV